MYHPTDSAALRCLRKDGDDPCLFILFLHMCNMKMPKSTYVAWCKYTVMIHVYGMNQCIYPLKKNWWFNKKMFIDNSIQTIACVFSNQDSSEVGLPGTKGRYQTPSNPWASAMVLTWSSDLMVNPKTSWRISPGKSMNYTMISGKLKLQTHPPITSHPIREAGSLMAD